MTKDELNQGAKLISAKLVRNVDLTHRLLSEIPEMPALHKTATGIYGVCPLCRGDRQAGLKVNLTDDELRERNKEIIRWCCFTPGCNPFKKGAGYHNSILGFPHAFIPASNPQEVLQHFMKHLGISLSKNTTDKEIELDDEIPF